MCCFLEEVGTHGSLEVGVRDLAAAAIRVWIGWLRVCGTKCWLGDTLRLRWTKVFPRRCEA